MTSSRAFCSQAVSPDVGTNAENQTKSAFCSQAEGSQRWLTIVGIGEDGLAGLGAEEIFNGRDHFKRSSNGQSVTEW